MEILKISFFCIVLIQIYGLIFGIKLHLIGQSSHAVRGVPFYFNCFVPLASEIEDEVSFHNNLPNSSFGFSKLKYGKVIGDIQPENENYELVFNGVNEIDIAEFRLTIKKPMEADVRNWWCSLKLSNVTSNFYKLQGILYFTPVLTGTSPVIKLRESFVFTCTVENTSRFVSYIIRFQRNNLTNFYNDRMNQSRESCHVVNDYSRYTLKCGSGTCNSSSSTKVYTLTIKETIPEDESEWFCTLEFAPFDTLLSNSLTLKFNGCKDFWYGDGCRKRCHCKSPKEVCNSTTGICLKDCADGWTGYACDTVCRCSGGCVDQKPCSLCKRGFKGYYCQEDIDECATQTHTCTNEGEECENTFGAFRCKCKKGYLNDRTHCYRRGQWGNWMKRKTECGENCRREVIRYRLCVDPPPVTGRMCEGKPERRTSEACTGGKCGVSHWSPWVKNYTECSKSCQRKVFLGRHCLDKSKTGGKCPGTSSLQYTEPCTGDQCDECAHGLHNCFRMVDKKCKDLPHSYECVCKEGYHKALGRTECLLIPAWSTWVKAFTSECSDSCRRKVELKRYCTSSECVGGSRQIIYENCTGGQCRDDSTTDLNRFDKCASKYHECVKYGEECINTGQRTFGCVCREGFVRKENKCQDAARWSGWQITYGKCEASCIRKQLWTRFCQIPTDYKNLPVNHCFGKNEKVETLSCHGDDCLDSGWTEWVNVQKLTCQRDCTQQVVRKRECRKLPHKNTTAVCPGNLQDLIKQDCVDGDCVMDECQTEMNTCYMMEGAKCVDHLRSYTCECRKGYTKVGKKCARDGGWSTWIANEWGKCDELSCRQFTQFKRYCTNPVPEPGAVSCIGMSEKSDHRRCLTPCTAAIKLPIKDSHVKFYLIGASLIAGVCLVVVVSLYYRFRRKLVSTSTSPIIKKRKEGVMPYENPTFTLTGQN